jgi:hypothetical protein
LGKVGSEMRTQGVLMTLALGAIVGLSVAETAQASSHREAPFIAKNPKTDATDLYVFRSYELGREEYVTILANYQPFQGAYGGPNFFSMDDQALYEIEVDNVGDGKEHLTFQFQFNDDLPNGGLGLTMNVPPNDGGPAVPVPFLNLGGITAATQATATNRNETYTVTEVVGDRRTGTPYPVTAATGGATSFGKPVDYIGPTSLGNAAAYESYARSFITNVSIHGCTPPTGTSPRVWVGQRAEPFAVNLGVVFDLLGAPGSAATLTGTGPAPSANPIGNYNITTIALEIPISCLATATQPIIGAWTTASVRQARVINPTGSYTTPTKEGGAWAQISRLGMPLVNELVIGLKDKDTFNSSEPSGDGQFIQYVTNPTLPAAIQALFGPTAAPAPALYPRTDLEAVFLTGVPNVNLNGSTAEMIRFNTSLPVTYATGETIGDAGTVAGQQPLGAALCFVNGALTLTNPGCDPAGFPNGRRPGDDVVDIALRVVEGYLIPGAGTGSTSTGVAPAGDVGWTDDVIQNDTLFPSQAFPYFNTPNPG